MLTPPPTRRGLAPAAARLMISMAIGLVLTVLVAWSAVLACPSQLETIFWGGAGVETVRRDGWEGVVPESWSDSVVCQSRSHYGATEMWLFGAPTKGNSDGSPAQQQVITAGLPMRALQCERTMPYWDGCGCWTGGVPNILRRWAADPEKAALPVRIVPLGFAVNVLCFGTPFAAIMLIPMAIGARRRRTGRCAGCGHQLAIGQDRCPECGGRVDS